jgi:hypothetical protein
VTAPCQNIVAASNEYIFSLTNARAAFHDKVMNSLIIEKLIPTNKHVQQFGRDDEMISYW